VGVKKVTAIKILFLNHLCNVEREIILRQTGGNLFSTLLEEQIEINKML